jgi:V/A-type H+/Na+-transporting ATPase subunit I
VLVPMTKVQIIGRKPRVDEVLERLYRLRLLQLASAGEEPELELSPFPGEAERAARVEELRLLVAQLDGLLALAGGSEKAQTPGDAEDAEALSRELGTLTPFVEPLVERIEGLQNEIAVLPRYIQPLRNLLPLVPELAELDESEIQALELDAIALVLNTDDDAVVDTLREALRVEFGDQFVLVSTRIERDAIGCVIVTPQKATREVQALLGRGQVRHLPLPPRYEGLSFRGAVMAMERRLGEIPAELDRAQRELRALLAPRAAAWRAARERLLGEVDRLEAVAHAGVTSRTFVVVGWTPRSQVHRLRHELERSAEDELVLEELAAPADAEPPVLMRNRRLAQPFEFLVRFLDLPRAGSLDPTMLMALLLPLMVGVMVGDVAYGALLLGLSLFVRRRFAARSPALRDLSRVFVAGALWAIMFGFLFGEALGDLGRRLGLPALWFYRGGADAVEPLLLFALALGAAHVVLGQLLGIWQSAQARRRTELLNRAGSLLALGGVFALAGVAAGRLPTGALAPSAAAGAVAVGVVLLVAGRGALGAIMGPLELISTVGNVLSYLRLAAVGLASAYLAVVANELAVLAPLWIGVFIAAFFHALNLALAALSPMIQALRLHYVEFFSKFYEGGGQPFRPFGERGAT